MTKADIKQVGEEGNNEADRDQGQITKSDRHDQDDRNIGSDDRYGGPT